MKKLAGIVKGRLSKKKQQAPTALTLKREEAKITNSTVAEHREEVLGHARRFRYPHVQSRHRIVFISLGLATVSLLTVFIWSLTLLYKQQSTSGYAYQFTNFFPVPVARVDGNFVSYESYLFELRHNMHYKRTQENVDFTSVEGKQQLQGLKEQALDKVVNDRFIAKKANQNGISVSGEDIDNQIKALQERSELGADQSVLEGVLKKYYNWNFQDFRRSIYLQLLRQKYLAFMEKDKLTLAEDIANQARGGADFATLAKQFSQDDSTKENGGLWPPIVSSNKELPKNLVDKVLSMKSGEVSDPIEVPYGIEVIKVLDNNGTEVKTQHIALNYTNLQEILDRERSGVKVSRYIKF